MLFQVEITFRVAFFPFPTLFITAYCKERKTECINAMFKTLVPILECGTNKFKASFIVNEPSIVTHNLETLKL